MSFQNQPLSKGLKIPSDTGPGKPGLHITTEIPQELQAHYRQGNNQLVAVNIHYTDDDGLYYYEGTGLFFTVTGSVQYGLVTEATRFTTNSLGDSEFGFGNQPNQDKKIRVRFGPPSGNIAEEIDIDFSNANVNASGSELNWGGAVRFPLGQDFWHEPTLLNNWQNYGGDYMTVGYRKDPFDYVELRGLIRLGSSEIAFQLPASYRPSKRHIFGGTSSSNKYGRVDVDSSGYVRINIGTTGTDFVSLAGIRFDAGYWG